MIKCKKCGKSRKSRVFILFPMGNYKKEVMYKAYCSKCKRDIVFLWSYKDNGDIEKRQIFYTRKFLETRVICYEEKPLNKNWKKAKGFRYFKGFRSGIRGGYYRLSDDFKESIFKACQT